MNDTYLCPWCGAENRVWRSFWFIAGLLTFGIALMIPSVCSRCGKGAIPTEVRKQLAKWVLFIIFIVAPVLFGIISAFMGKK